MIANHISRTLQCAIGLALFSGGPSGCGTDDPLAAEPFDGEAAASLSQSLTAAQIDTLRAQLVVEINKARAIPRLCGTMAFRAAPPLRRHVQLDMAAQSHSVDMATKNYFSSIGVDGSTPASRILDAGYTFASFGESRGYNTATAAATVQAWITGGQCGTLMSAVYVDIGVGYGYSAASSYKHLWTADFASPK